MVAWRNLVSTVVVLLALYAGTARAQDQGNFTHFFINPYVLNPSYAGLDGQASASLIFRKQWMTIEGAPTIANLSLHAPVNTRLGVGVNVNNDSKGFFNNSTLLVSVSYHLPLQDYSFVRFGLSAGGSWNTVDMDKLGGINDRALGSVLDNSASLAGNAGISFHHRTFNAGISLPSIFSPTYVSEDAFNVREVRPFQAMILHATNRFYFNNDKNIFEPYLLYHANMDLPSLFELAGIVHLNHMVWAGASYKQYFGISALGGLKLKNSLALGASYSIKQSGIDELNSPSFEVSINYLFGAHKRNAPVYSFVNAVKPKTQGQSVASKQASGWRQKQIESEKERREEAARVRAEQEEKKRQAAAERKLTQSQNERARLAQQAKAAEQRSLQEQQRQRPSQEETAPLVTEEEKSPVAVVQPRASIDEERLVMNDPVAANPPIETKNEDVPQQTVPQQVVEQPGKGDPLPQTVKPDVVAERVEEDQPVVSVQPAENERVANGIEAPTGQPEIAEEVPAPPQREKDGTVRHEIFQRGNHPQELPASEYVVAGAFKSIDNARSFAEGLRNLDFNAQSGHLTANGLWYVYLFKTDDIRNAKAEHERVSKIFLLRDAWLLTVRP